jgi:phenol 2-monooxygenase
LLHTYSDERRAVAQELIDFDREWASLLSKSAQGPDADGNPGVDPAEVQRYFVQHGRYTAGTATCYRPALLTGDGKSQHLAEGFVIGMRFHSAPVVRLADGKPVRLGDALEADGRWRIFLFADSADPSEPDTQMQAVCAYLEGDARSPVRRYTPAGSDGDSVIDVRAILQQDHKTVDLGVMPGLLLPRKGRYGLIDYEKVFCPDFKSGNDIFDMRRIDRGQGAMVIVRPDQYVAQVLPLDAHGALAAFFDSFMVAAS